jgi:hypothetical protein
MSRSTTAKRMARLRTRGRLALRECAALAPLRPPASRAMAAVALLIALGCCAHWLSRAG